MKKHSILVLLFIITLTSCASEDDLLESDKIRSFAFGHSYGECIGDGCVMTFMIQENQLFKDTVHQYGFCNNSNFRDGGFVLMPDSSYQKVKDLINQIPAELLDNEEGAIGMPDSYDQGGFQVRIVTKNESKCWLIDTDDSNIPGFLESFNDSIRTNIEKLVR